MRHHSARWLISRGTLGLIILIVAACGSGGTSGTVRSTPPPSTPLLQVLTHLLRTPLNSSLLEDWVARTRLPRSIMGQRFLITFKVPSYCKSTFQIVIGRLLQEWLPIVDRIPTRRMNSNLALPIVQISRKVGLSVRQDHPHSAR